MATTIIECLKGLSAYPIPLRTLAETGEGRGLTLTDTATKEILHGSAYNLAVADLLTWLALAPDVSQGGQTYSFTDEQRQMMRSRANALYAEYGETNDSSIPQPIYGYKGSRL